MIFICIPIGKTVCRDENAGVSSEDEASSAGSDGADFMEDESQQHPCIQQNRQHSGVQISRQQQNAAQHRPGHAFVNDGSSNNGLLASQQIPAALESAAAGVASMGTANDLSQLAQQVQQQQQQPSQQLTQQPSQQALSGDQLVVLYSSCLKLASENKIDKHNSWQLGLIDHLVCFHDFPPPPPPPPPSCNDDVP